MLKTAQVWVVLTITFFYCINCGCDDGKDTLDSGIDYDSDSGDVADAGIDSSTDSDADTESDSGSDTGSDDDPDTSTDTDTSSTECEGIISFPDNNLEEAIREYLSISTADILYDDIKELERLEAQNRGISNISGMECFISIRFLDLLGNEISDIRVLRGLTSLNSLNLTGNEISTISPDASPQEKT